MEVKDKMSIVNIKVSIKTCPKCGFKSGYTRSLSRTDKCGNLKCDYKISVGKISDIDLDRMRHNG